MEVILKKINTLFLGKLAVLVLFLMLACSSILMILNDTYVIVAYAFLFVGSIFFVSATSAFLRYSKEIKKMTEISKKSASGVLYHRITHIDKTEEIGELAWSLNNMLDQFEAFSRDLDASLKAVTQGQSHRKMMPSGLHGDFVRLSNSINNALDAIAVAQSKDEAIKEMVKTLGEYKSGSYSKKIDLTSMQDDVIALATGINELGDALCKLSDLNLSNGLALQEGSETLARNVKSLSDSATSQAASLEETSASLEQITSNMRQSSENTFKMANYAQEVTTSVKNGQDLANKTAVSMDQINEQTSSITEAITVIDQIAFQTNILSLNAAVEAATAGEAGKGFAVVAAEVRNLASRSAEAAKEIKDIVEKATSKAQDGKDIADEMISGYTKLNENITSTIDLIEHVASSTKEQEQGIIQINDAIATLDKQTQENASIAHETNVVAQQSHDIAEQIVKEAKQSS